MTKIRVCDNLNITQGGAEIELEKAFILIVVEMGTEKEVLGALNKILEVQEAHQIYGVYDIIVKIEAEIRQDLRDAIALKIRCLDKIRSTVTMMVI